MGNCCSIGFSFRDVADDVGIKSSSVHYHFPTEEALGTAIAQRYVERLRDALAVAGSHTEQSALEAVTQIFIDANKKDDLMCLCGILGAQSDQLPEEISVHIAHYFA